MYKNQYLRLMLKKVGAIVVIVVFNLLTNNVFSQVNIRDSVISAPIIDFSYGYKIPGGDLGERFGASSEIGLSFFMKTETNLLYGVDWTYIFGNEVKDLDFTNGFRDSQGSILANNGLYSEVYFTERGFTLTAKIGKIIPVFNPNPNSGIMVLVGAGFLQHKIKIEDRFQEVPLLSSDKYYQGYDRLSNGFLLTEFIGYRLLSNRKLINLFGGFEFTQGFTKNRREINFDTGVKDTTKRIDLQMGIRIGFSLPLYKQITHDYYYN